ncbi:SIS domain-containing protein [Microbacterium candidum]|uniref:SIS domain-containing protein n=1 Tax=Microbacterium candidum TaxID=3041922 RepID=A0ABT7MXT9_9MICO|nr:SIS domain-containing protein [Microbacterium sp. ASV49]MDL9979256.1 SIS domain-containing protein [Microbacterium sp. ASV49]
MLNFDAERFIRIQNGALDLAGPLQERVEALMAEGARNVFFLGAGGAGKLMEPAAQLISRSSDFPVHLENAAELVAMGSSNLGPGSIVVIPSLSGTTREAVAVLDYAQQRGAKVIGLTAHEDSPVAQKADFAFTTFAQDDTSSESFYLQSLVIALSILNRLGRCDAFESTLAQLRTLPSLLAGVKEAFEETAAKIAGDIQHDEYHIVTAAGPTWTEAWYYGTCILEEMQWIRTRPVHSSDFFHGTLELVEAGVSVLVFKGEDASRPLVERVERWLPSVTERMTVIDTAEFALPGISPEVRALIPHVLVATVLERVSAHLEVLRDHPLTTRRYYRRIDY